jgi:hypothetical protein
MNWIDSFTALAYILNFLIIVYLILSSLGTECLTIFNLSISFFGLFASIVVNIISLVDDKNK